MADKQWEYASIYGPPNTTDWVVYFGNATAALSDTAHQSKAYFSTREGALGEAVRFANHINLLEMTGGSTSWINIPSEVSVPDPPPRVIDRTLRSSVRPGRG